MPLNLFKRNVSNKERRTTMKEEDELLKKCSVRVIVGPPKQDTPIFTAAETEQFSDEYIETILDHSMMDDYTLYQYLTDANSDMYN